MPSRYEEDPEIKVYLDNALTTQWNMALEYCNRFPDQSKMNKLRAKLNTYKAKIYKRVNALKEGIAER